MGYKKEKGFKTEKGMVKWSSSNKLPSLSRSPTYVLVFTYEVERKRNLLRVLIVKKVQGTEPQNA